MGLGLKLAVVGSRSFEDAELMRQWIETICRGVLPTDLEIISGGARGADKLAGEYAFQNRITYVEYPADWERDGRAAGMMRNTQIVGRATAVLAFWDGKSPGTADTINKAVLAKKPVTIIAFGGGHEDHTRLLFN